jgi:hypothetical protein
VKTDYHKRIEEIDRAVDRLRFHATTSARALEDDSDLKQRALEHLYQALENLVRSCEVSKESRRRREISSNL